MHTKAVLFIHHCQTQIVKFNTVLKKRVSANQNVDGAIRQGRQNLLAQFSLFAACEN